MKKILFVMAAAVLFAGCAESPETDGTQIPPGGDGAIAFRGVAGGDGSSTRIGIADGTEGLSFSWIQNSDMIGLFASDGDGVIKSNSCYKALASGAVADFEAVSAENEISWGTGSHDFHAYHPYSAEAGGDIAAIPVSVPAIQTQTDGSPSHIAPLNFIYSQNKGVSQSDNAVELAFSHVFSVLNVQLTSVNGDAVVSAVKFRCTDAKEVLAYDKATLDLGTGAVTIAPDAVKSGEIVLTLDPAVTVGASPVNAYMLITPGHGGKTFQVAAVVGGEEKVVASKVVPAGGIPAGVKAVIPAITGSDGTAEYPYILTSAAEVRNMNNLLVENQTVYFELGADIDMSSVGDWIPLNADNKGKAVHFDGKGHVIKNFSISGEAYGYMGFFGILIGDIINTGFVDVNINTPKKTTGAIAGYMGLGGDSKGGRVENCYVTGKVVGDTAGGIVGRLGKTSATGTCYVKNSYSTAEVSSSSGNFSAGGIAGYVFANSAIANCYSTGRIGSSNDKAGGIAYSVAAGANISNCVARNPSVVAPTGNPGRISALWVSTGVGGGNCWAQEGMRLLGSSGEVSASDSPTPAAPYHGVAKTREFLSDMSNYTSWDRTEVWHSQTVNGGFPILKWQYERGDYAALGGHPAVVAGNGSQTDPYILTNAADVREMHNLTVAGLTSYFELAGDVDMAGIDWAPLCPDAPYNKQIHLDGKGHVIRNLTCKNLNYASFFGVLIGDCLNTGFENVDIRSNNLGGPVSAYIGVGGNSAGGRVENCYVTGKVAGDAAGGVVGRLGTSSESGVCYVKNCYSTAEVSATGGASPVGGIAAYVNAGSVISNCYSTGDLTSAQDKAGGIAYQVLSGGDINNSIAWNGSVSVASGTPGRIAALWAGAGTGENCLAYDGMKLYSNLVEVTGIEDSATPASPYHGTARTADGIRAWAAANWAADVWNFTGEYPKLYWE